MLFGAPVAGWLSVCLVLLHGVRWWSGEVQIAEGVTFGEGMLYQFGLYVPLFVEGFVWQPVSYMFLHVSWWHCLLNVWVLLLTGGAFERCFGWRWMVGTFLGSGIFAGVVWLAWANWVQGDAVLCVGASGGIAGLLTAFCVGFWRERIRVLIVGIPARISGWVMWTIFWLGCLGEWWFLSGSVAFMAHVGGGVAGCVLGRFVRRAWLQRRAMLNRMETETHE